MNYNKAVFYLKIDALGGNIHAGFAHEYPALAGIFCGDAKNWYRASIICHLFPHPSFPRKRE
jgi:hypothetical protein